MAASVTSTDRVFFFLAGEKVNPDDLGDEFVMCFPVSGPKVERVVKRTLKRQDARSTLPRILEVLPGVRPISESSLVKPVLPSINRVQAKCSPRMRHLLEEQGMSTSYIDLRKVGLEKDKNS